MNIKLRIADENDSEKWDKLVESSPHGSIFNTWKFLKIIEKHTNSKLYPIMGVIHDRVIGIFPIFFSKKFYIRAVFSPPPHVAVPYLGPLITDYNSLNFNERESNYIYFQKKVDEFTFQELKPNYVYVVSSPNLFDARPFMWSKYEVKPQYNYIIDLANGEEFLRTRFLKNLRENIARTARREVIVNESGKDGLMNIYENYSRRYYEQNRNPPITKDYLLDVFDTFYPENLRIFISSLKGEVLGGTMNLCYNGKFTSWIGSAKTNISGLSPNDLTQWECIKWASKNNFKIYEEIGANTERLWQFKSKYNPDLSTCFNASKYSSSFYKWMENLYKVTKR